MIHKPKTKLGFLASARGTNMQAIIDACKTGGLPAQPVVVISNNRNSGALGRARAEGIAGYHLSSSTYPDPEQLDRKIAATLQEHGVEIVILAGYMKKIGKHTLAAYKGRILNIHPALLPKYGGAGMYGMHVHAAVLANRDRQSGATIHVVDAGYDSGPILAQKTVIVAATDTAETLSRKVLAIEHELYVATLDRILKGEIQLSVRNK
ncbi:MAG: phosphoribosylglycinamide formyltransferase [Gammaproteobacteria bacterium RIFCSPLOWO2_02_FULL_52_10]|nr:MAG: phosphoribosylglycinamide formyltransferase [Gammaproteobacteria bacterium RIFCSPLOWO2_02_FULL_52_10]